MDNKIQLFENNEFGSVRAMEIDGQPWFVGRDIASALGYEKPRNALNRHVEPQDSLKRGVTDSIGRVRSTTLINESGMYRLIFSSKLPKAREFTHWVTSVVLPTIREFCAFIEKQELEELLADSETGKQLFSQLLEDAMNDNNDLMEIRDELVDINKILAPKAEYYDDVIQSPDALPISVIAKDYGMSAIAFNKLLHGLHIQYNLDGTWLLYEEHCGKGYTRERIFYINEDTERVHTLWTQRGRRFLNDILSAYSILQQTQ